MDLWLAPSSLHFLLAGSGDSGRPAKWLSNFLVDAKIRPCRQNCLLKPLSLFHPISAKGAHLLPTPPPSPLGSLEWGDRSKDEGLAACIQSARLGYLLQ